MTSPYFLGNKPLGRETDRMAHLWALKTKQRSGSNASSSPSSGKSSRSESGWSSIDQPSAFTPVGTPTRAHSTPRAEDELIVVPVKLTTPHQRSSSLGAEELPERPPPRSWFCRLKTRIFDCADDGAEYRIVKMPRAEYRKYFAKNRSGKYGGTEPEREWDEEALREVFGRYQEWPVGYGL